MRRVALSVMMTMLVLCPALFIQGEGIYEPLTVILTYPDIEYNIGDEITAQAHIFRKGVRTDPEVVIFTAGDDYDRYPMARSSEGLWEGTVQITKEQIYTPDRFPIEVKVTANTPEHEWDFDSHLVYVSNVPQLHVSTYIDDDEDQLPAPGDMVDFTITVSYGDRFVDPDPGTLRAWVTASEHAYTENLTVVRRAAGVYYGNYLIPSDFQRDIFLRLRAEAKYTGEFDTEYDRSVADMYLKRYTTWVQFVLVEGPKVNVEINVVDLDSAPVVNAPISVNLTYLHPEDEYLTTGMNLTTGTNGIASLEVPMEGISPTSWGVGVFGDITVNGYVQRLGCWVPNPGYIGKPIPSNDGFRVYLQNDQPIPAGTNVNLRFKATYDGTPLAGIEVDSYLYGDHSVLFNGTMTTDDGGKFVIDQDIPDLRPESGWRDRFEGQFKADTLAGFNTTWQTYDFSYFASSSDYQSWRDPGTTLDLVRIDEGTYQFSLRSPGLDGEGDYVRVEWGLWARDDHTLTFPRWSSGDYQNNLERPVEAMWSGDAWVGTVQLPSIIPGDTTFNLKAGFLNMNEPHSDWRFVRIRNSTEYLNNEPPTLDILEPSSGEIVEGSFLIKGTASDDSSLQLVEVRIDGGPWTSVTGTDDWELEVMADELEEGFHTVEAWSFDGVKRSKVDTVEFNYIRVEHSSKGPAPILVIIIVLILIAVAMILILRTRSAR